MWLVIGTKLSLTSGTVVPSFFPHCPFFPNSFGSNINRVTPQKSKITIFKRSHLFQGPSFWAPPAVSFFGGRMTTPMSSHLFQPSGSGLILRWEPWICCSCGTLTLLLRQWCLLEPKKGIQRRKVHFLRDFFKDPFCRSQYVMKWSINDALCMHSSYYNYICIHGMSGKSLKVTCMKVGYLLKRKHPPKECFIFSLGFIVSDQHRRMLLTSHRSKPTPQHKTSKDLAYQHTSKT